jgi:hypothetical protein
VTDFIEENSNVAAFGTGPLVAVLMGTHNGARFLPEQLNSLQAQTHQNWVLIASDDGSTDDTVRILKLYQAKWPVGKLAIPVSRLTITLFVIKMTCGCLLSWKLR